MTDFQQKIAVHISKYYVEMMESQQRHLVNIHLITRKTEDTGLTKDTENRVLDSIPITTTHLESVQLWNLYGYHCDARDEYIPVVFEFSGT